MRIKNLEAGKLESVILRLIRTGYVEDDGENYVIPKNLFKAALLDPLDAPESSVRSQDERPLPDTLIGLITLFSATYSEFYKARYKTQPTDWAKLRQLIRRKGVPACSLRVRQYFMQDSVHEPTVGGFVNFVNRQTQV